MNFIINLLLMISLGSGANYFLSDLYTLSSERNAPDPFNLPNNHNLLTAYSFEKQHDIGLNRLKQYSLLPLCTLEDFYKCNLDVSILLKTYKK